MTKSRAVITILLGIFLAGLAAVLFVHDSNYIFTGKTLDLNDILENNGEIPRDKYVTYTCYLPIDNYAETTQTLNGIIPLPFLKTQQYSMLCENGKVISAKVGSKKKIQEMEQALDDFYDTDNAVAVTLTGCIHTISPEMHGYLEESCNYVFEGLDTTGIDYTYFVIDTTQTRLSQTLMYTFLFFIGLFCIFGSVKHLTNN